MKKVLMSVALISAIGIAAGYSMIGSDKSDVNISKLTKPNIEAMADDNPCPNGCLCTGGQCYCNGKHPFEEYGNQNQ